MATRVLMREIQADTEAIWKERRELLEDIRGMASGLVDSADAAAARFPSRGSAGPEEEMQEPQAGDETEPPGVATFRMWQRAVAFWWKGDKDLRSDASQNVSTTSAPTRTRTASQSRKPPDPPRKRIGRL